MPFIDCYNIWNTPNTFDVEVGLLIFAFYFTSNILLYYQHLLVNMEQRSKKDLDSEQLLIL